MSEVILTEIKSMLDGIPEDTTDFDDKILSHINGALMSAKRLGLRGDVPLVATKTTTFNDLFTKSEEMVSAIKNFIYIKVKLVFDPPSNDYGIKALERMLKETVFDILEEENDGY